VADEGIRIRIGCSVDASTSSILAPIEQAAKRARKAVENDLGAAAKSAEKATAKSAKAQAGSWAALEKEVEAMASQILKDEEKAAKAGVAAVAKAEKQKVSEIDKQSKAIDAIRRRSSLAAGKWAAQEAAKIKREQERAIPWYARNVSPASWGHGGQIGIGKRAGVSVSRTAAMAYGLGGSALSGAMGIGREFLQGMGVDTSLASHVAQSQQQNKLATTISNAGYVPGTQLIAPQTILREAREAANATGTDTNEILEGMQKFVGLTGDLETARDTVTDMAKLAKATGTSFDDMSAASAEVTNHLIGVEDKGKVVSTIMRTIAGEGKLGAVEIKDLAVQMAKIAAASNKFKGGAAANIGILGAMAQEAKLKGGAASASQAATSALRFATGFQTGTTLKHWQKLGLTPYTNKQNTQLTDPESIVLAALEKSEEVNRKRNGPKAKGASMDVLKQMFPSEMGGRAVYGFADIYNEAGGGSAGTQAVKDEFQRFADATMATTEVERAFEAQMKTSESAVNIFNNKMTEVSGDVTAALLPAFEELAPVIVDVASGLANFITTLSKGTDIQDVAHDVKDLGVGSSAKDMALLNKLMTGGLVPYDPNSPNATPTIPAELYSVIQGHAKTRGAGIGELQTRISQEEEEAKLQRMPMGSTKKAEELEAAAAKDKQQLAELQAEQVQTNVILRAIAESNATIADKVGKPPPPVHTPGSPIETDAPKD
jgi:hypothetical protein